MDDDSNLITSEIHDDQDRPAVTVPVVLISNDTQSSQGTNSVTPKWSSRTKKTVIIGLLIIALVCLFFLRKMITPMILSCLLVFYLKPIVLGIQKKWNIPHKLSVIIVFGVFLILVLAVTALGGYSIYGQTVNLLDLINNSVENLSDSFLNFLGGAESQAGSLYVKYFGSSQAVELNQQLQGLTQSITSAVLSFVQSLSSKIGWFFFVYGFSFFVVWEMKENGEVFKRISIPGYDHDITMGMHHLSLIWRRFLWGQMILLLISLCVYSVLFVILGVKYALILSAVVGLTRMIPYVGSFFAWGAVGLVTLFQGSTIFGMQPFVYALFVVGISFVIDKFMDGFIQPKFLAETLKVHPAAVLTSALICGRTMGFLGIFLSAPLAATLKLVLRYINRKLRDEDPWKNIQTVAEPLQVNKQLEQWKCQSVKLYDKLKSVTVNLKSFIEKNTGGKRHGSNGLKD